MKYRTKSAIKSSIDAVKSAIQSYNSPFGNHRFNDYVILMIIGWNRLLQAYFIENNIKYFCMNKKKTRYIYVDKTKKTWDISESIKYAHSHEIINQAQVKNLGLFINIRNRIEHNTIADDFIMESTFGESQSLLFNYENILVTLFDNNFSLNESLRFTLQFSTIYHKESLYSMKSMMTNEAQNLYEYIKKYKENLDDEIFKNFDFSVRLIQMPDVSNTKSSDFSVTFIKPENQKEEDRLRRFTTLIKEKQILPEEITTLKPSSVAKKIQDLRPEIGLTTHYMKYIVFPLGIRPYNKEIQSGAKTSQDINPKYCVYLSDYNSYSYKLTLITLIYHIFERHGNEWIRIFKEYYNQGVVLEISKYE